MRHKSIYSIVYQFAFDVLLIEEGLKRASFDCRVSDFVVNHVGLNGDHDFDPT